MDLRSYLRLFRRRWLAILLLAVLGTASGALAAWAQPPVYAVKAQLFVFIGDSAQDSGQAYEDVLLAQQRAKFYATLLTSDSVLKKVVDESHVPYEVNMLRKQINVSAAADTAVIDITVKDRSVRRAKVIAETVGPVFSEVVAGADAPARRGVRITASPKAVVKVLNVGMPAQVSPRTSLDITLGTVVGIVLGIGWAVVRENTDTRIRDADDVDRASGITTLGVLADDAEFDGLMTGSAAAQQRQLEDRRRPRSHHTASVGAQDLQPTPEVYRSLGITMQCLGSGSGSQSYALTGASHDAGTTFTAAGLAIALAEGGSTVILVDAEPPGTRLSQLLGLSPARGLRDVLAGRASVDEALLSWRDNVPLMVLVGGGRELDGGAVPLQQPSLVALRDDLLKRADVVIFAAPPVLTRADALIVASVVGQAVIVVRTKSTRYGELDQSVQRLHSVGVKVLGAVLDGVAHRDR